MTARDTGGDLHWIVTVWKELGWRYKYLFPFLVVTCWYMGKIMEEVLDD